MKRDQERLRVAFIAGTLGLGGAEKQLTLMARSLVQAGAEVRVLALTGGAVNEQILARCGAPCVTSAGSHPPPLRLGRIIHEARRFRPHVLQAAHSFVNVYAALAARSAGCISVGALRGSLRGCRESNGRWTRLQLGLPDIVAANSQRAIAEVTGAGLVPAARIRHLPNALAPEDFVPGSPVQPRPVALFAGRLIPGKRLDLFLTALAAARIQEPSLFGVVAGDGPERASGEKAAREFRLLPDGVEFTGELPSLRDQLRRASMLVFCSDDDEGTPNVVLEAMAAGVPVICTPAGDAASVTGHESALHVPFRDPAAIAERMLRLARDADFARRMGEAGRRQAEANHSARSLAGKLFSVYRDAARVAARPLAPMMFPSSEPGTVTNHV